MTPRTRRRGSQSSEFLFTFPLLLLLVAGGLEYGWAILRSVQLDHAARVGAREAALSGATAIAVEDRVNAALLNAGISGGTVEIDPPDPDATEPGEVITIRVEVPYEKVRLLGIGDWLPQPTALRGRASMVREPNS